MALEPKGEKLDQGIERPTVAFVFDRVMHYHKATLQRIESELEARGWRFVLLCGREKPGATGRAALQEKIVCNQFDFELYERPVSSFMLRFQKGVASAISGLSPAVVVTMCHSGTLSEWQLIRLKRRVGFRLVAWQCGYEYNPGRLKRWVLSKFIPRFDHHLAYHTNAKAYAQAHGADVRQVTVMHNTIDEGAIKCIPKTEARAIVEQRHPILKGKKIVLYVGAVLAEKRLELVFEALNVLDRDDVVFLIVGDGDHAGQIQRLYGQRADCLSVGRIVEGVGIYFDAADVFVLPGTGGLAINEAMAHSLPVVSSYADGSADDLVVHGENGYRLRDGTAKELASSLGMLLDDSATAESMGAKGRLMITGHLSFENFIARVMSVLVPKPKADAGMP